MGQNEHEAGTDLVARGDGVEMVRASETRADSGTLVLAARAEAEIKARAFIAIQRPRSIESFRKKLLDACARPRFADAAIYEKPIGREKIEGLSIRFAEECARHYGNLDIYAMVISEDDEFRNMECCVVDLETNMQWRLPCVIPKTVERKKKNPGDEVLRSRTNSFGETIYVRRATVDEIFVQQNALLSKTMRNLILNHIPSDIKEEALEKMHAVLAGEITDNPIEYRKRLVDSFYKYGVTHEMIAEYLGKPIDQANPAELSGLARIGNAIKLGETTWPEAMEAKSGRKPPEPVGPKGGASAKLADVAKGSATDRIEQLRAKKHPTDDELEDIRQWDQDHPKA